MARRVSAARVKINRSYTVGELAEATGATEATVRRWINRGLPVLTAQRPALILGHDARAFLGREADRRKRPTPIGQFFCLRCKVPRQPALCMADYRPISTRHGRLVALCDTCEGICSRIVSASALSVWHPLCQIAGSGDRED